MQEFRNDLDVLAREIFHANGCEYNVAEISVYILVWGQMQSGNNLTYAHTRNIIDGTEAAMYPQ